MCHLHTVLVWIKLFLPNYLYPFCYALVTSFPFLFFFLDLGRYVFTPYENCMELQMNPDMFIFSHFVV